METHFWLNKWKNNELGFHKREANPLLVHHFPELALGKGDRVFVPLCGKTLDISWLLAQGYRVAGAELVEMAIEQLFMELGVEPQISAVGDLKQYSAEHIDIFVGDIFQVSRLILGPIDAVYDRAALVALPKEMRDRYTAHLMDLTHAAPQLLVTYEYDQSVMDGPPFSISPEEVDRHYQETYEVTLLNNTEVPGGLKGKCAAYEKVWLLQQPSPSSPVLEGEVVGGDQG